jgi:hypothetical protein
MIWKNAQSVSFSSFQVIDYVFYEHIDKKHPKKLLPIWDAQDSQFLFFDLRILTFLKVSSTMNIEWWLV